MKWFIFLILIACGHQEPKEVDLQDADGDLIANAYEVGPDRFISEIKPLDKIHATLVISTPGHENINVQLTNISAVKDDAIRALGENVIMGDPPFFVEHSNLHVVRPVPPLPPAEHYTVTIKFDAQSESFHTLALSHLGERMNSFPWSRNLELYLGHKTVQEILMGNMVIDLDRTHEETLIKERVKERTYRVLMYDGNETKVFYVSQSLPFRTFIELQNLDSPPRNVLEGKLTWMNDQTFGWWFREDNPKEKVVFYGSSREVKLAYLQGLESQHVLLERKEGESQNILRMNFAEKKTHKLFVTISSLGQRIRSFSENTHTRSWGGERDYHCNLILRSVSGESQPLITEAALYENLNLKLDGEQVELENVTRHLVMKSTSSGTISWDLGLEIEASEMEISLRASPAGLGAQGVTWTNCSKHYAQVNAQPISIESYFGLSMNAYVEN